MELFRQICYGMMALHRQKIALCDIKADNILVFSHPDKDYKYAYSMQISDFGISKQIKGDYNSKGKGTRSSMAPEVYHTFIYNENADLYSLGCVLYYMLKQKIPISGTGC